jgi:hypothetical protein
VNNNLSSLRLCGRQLCCYQKFQLIFLQKYVKIPASLPAGKRQTAPQGKLLVSADTRRKLSFVKALKPLMEITIEYQPILEAPAALERDQAPAASGIGPIKNNQLCKTKPICPK